MVLSETHLGIYGAVFLGPHSTLHDMFGKELSSILWNMAFMVFMVLRHHSCLSSES